MKIIYLINSKEYNYHKCLAEDFISVTGGTVIDMGSSSDHGAAYYELEEKAPDVVITFDLAGHVLRTGNNTLSLNNIYARFAHILFHKPEHYGRHIKARENLSMFMYIPFGNDIEECRSRCTDVPNIEEFVEISYKAETYNEHKNNRLNIQSWWNDFKKDAML